LPVVGFVDDASSCFERIPHGFDRASDFRANVCWLHALFEQLPSLGTQRAKVLRCSYRPVVPHVVRALAVGKCEEQGRELESTRFVKLDRSLDKTHIDATGNIFSRHAVPELLAQLCGEEGY